MISVSFYSGAINAIQKETEQDMNRREAIGGMAGLACSQASLANQINPGWLADTAGPMQKKRRLTVKELQPGELEHVMQAAQEAETARLRAHEAEVALKKKYGQDYGVEVSFEYGYVMIRDYRDVFDAKQDNESAYLQQSGINGLIKSNSRR